MPDDTALQEVPSNSELDVLDGETCPKKLEAALNAGLETLVEMRKILGQNLRGEKPNFNTISLRKNVQDLISQGTAPVRCVIVFVGPTGSGKSSSSNAILEEHGLLPTDGMKACTSVPIEIEYNEDENPKRLYRAEVEFIDEESWEKELNELLQDIEDGGNENFVPDRGLKNDNQMAIAIAMAKVKAVYPFLKDQDLKVCNFANLMAQIRSKSILGRTKTIFSATRTDFRRLLHPYLISNEKQSQGLKVPQHWPLIKVVRIFVKSPVLKTGAVLVDLPGGQDYNAARSAVADAYMQKATHTFIFTPIQRAKDDKAAQDLLGSKLRQQLMMDGQDSHITFVCTKADDIDAVEIFETFDDWEEEPLQEWKRFEAACHRNDELAKDLAKAEREHKNLRDFIRFSGQGLKEWEARREQCKTVLEVKYSSSKRRKGNAGSELPRIRTATLTDCENKCNSIATSLAKAKEDMNKSSEVIESMQKSLRKSQLEAETIHQKLNGFAVTRRNAESKKAIRKQFKEETRRYKQAIYEVEKSADIVAIAEGDDQLQKIDDLSVFTVSSRAFQHLAVNKARTGTNCVIENISQTEIPALRAHCIKLTEAGRVARCRRFLNGLKGMLISNKLWLDASTSSDEGQKLRRDRLKVLLIEQITRLKISNENTFDAADSSLRKVFTRQVFDRLPNASSVATNKAIDIVQKIEIGTKWNTYKAVCRRDGTYNNGRRAYDVNHDLALPMTQAILNGWQTVFEQESPNILKDAYEKLLEPVAALQLLIDKESRSADTVDQGHQLLLQNMGVYRKSYADLTKESEDIMIEDKRRIHRKFTPAIQDHIRPAYSECSGESGSGMFDRMKTCMRKHVNIEKNIMFTKLATEIEQELIAMLSRAVATLRIGGDAIALRIERDCRNLVGGRDEDTAKKANEAEQALPVVIKEELDMAEMKFSQHYHHQLRKDEVSNNGNDPLFREEVQYDAMEVDNANDMILVEDYDMEDDSYNYDRWAKDFA